MCEGRILEMKSMLCGAVCIMLLIMAASPSFALQVGDRAPLFEAFSTKGKIMLEDYRRKKHVVLAFYFADFTPT